MWSANPVTTSSTASSQPRNSRHNHWRAGCSETGQSGSAGDHAEKDLPNRHLAAWSTQFEIALGSDQLPDEGGEKPHLNLTMSFKDFQEQKGTADVENLGPLNAASVRRIACDSKILRVVLGAKSEVLDIGRASRTIPNAIRRALIHRDKGCAFPGCGRPPRQCHAHHIVHWADGGPTSLDNLVLLCSRDHRLIHHGGWTVKINDGLPEFSNGRGE
ncbi:HNH endonuclease [Kutzneria sp. NPDC052558]|uniref:HNH endonuclease signature motif containing protein n=1 Tax=Kutzneria sp. NPDC052558 TaxID=3364121 RepID=UPI0037C5EC5F